MGPDSSRTTKGGRSGRGHAAAIILVACACGWLVMELEILGVRALAPYFGTAVYVVTGSVIGVFLLSLSAGYVLGGWLSARGGSRGALGIGLAAAGLWMCAMPFIIEPVCEGMFNIGLDEKWGSLLAALSLFGVPTLLLGSVSPVAVCWLTTQARDSGFNAGMVLALSTAASFAGCIVTAFYLVLVSLRQTLFVSGGALMALGAAVLLWAVAEARRPSAQVTPGCKEQMAADPRRCGEENV